MKVYELKSTIARAVTWKPLQYAISLQMCACIYACVIALRHVFVNVSMSGCLQYTVPVKNVHTYSFKGFFIFTIFNIVE